MRYRRTNFDVLFWQESFTSGIRATIIKTLRATRPESSQQSNVCSPPRSRNELAIIRLREPQLRLVRRGLVAPCMHWNPPRQWETYAGSENVSSSAESDSITRT